MIIGKWLLVLLDLLAKITEEIAGNDSGAFVKWRLYEIYSGLLAGLNGNDILQWLGDLEKREIFRRNTE